MKTSTCSYIKMTATAAALLVAFGPVQAAEDDDIAQLTKPESSIEAGIGYVNKDNQRFGQYNGLKNDGVYGLLDVNVVQRDDATGTWLKFSGRNLGLDNRELRFEHNRQGNWGYFVEYGQTPRENPLTVSTRLGGAGATTQTINAAVTPYSLEMKTQRDALTLGFEKLFIGGFSVQVRFKNEEKDGARMYGQGTSNTVNFLTDPIDQITRQLDVTLAYAGERLQLSGGYYGTSFENKNKLLNIVGGIAGQTPMALPPDNQSHQLHLSGGYSFTSTTRGTFKAAYTHQTQDDTFIVLPTLSGRTNLGGVIDTKLLQAGITSRPLPKLSLLANIRYEDRPDKTPVALYNTVLPAPPNLRNVGDSFGVGLRGKPMERLELGADFSYSDINDEYRQRALAGAAIASLPDVSTKLTSLKAFAKYAIQKNAGVRLNYVYDRVNTNDWTWTNFTYLDGTRVFQNPNQKVHFIGVSYYYRWQ